MIREAEKYLGYPYVWGGASPSTSFDCSGFVCWVINNCGNGWNVGRTTADGLRSYCSYVSPSDAKPGDLIFFQGTYDTPGASHVGIYVGNNMMIHCGNPIQYTSKFLLAATFYGIWQTSLEGSEQEMNMRLKKVLDDIQKTENKILELQEHVRQLRIQKKQMEDAEIIKAIRSMKMDSRKMLTFLEGIQNGTVTMQFDEEGNLSMDNSETGIKKEENMDSEMSTGLIEEREDLEDEE